MREQVRTMREQVRKQDLKIIELQVQLQTQKGTLRLPIHAALFNVIDADSFIFYVFIIIIFLKDDGKTLEDAAAKRDLADQEGNLLYFHMRSSIRASSSNAEDYYRGWVIRLFCFAPVALLLCIILFYHASKPKDKANWNYKTVFGIHLTFILGFIGIFWYDDFKSTTVKQCWNFLTLRSYTCCERRSTAKSGVQNQPQDSPESERLVPPRSGDD